MCVCVCVCVCVNDQKHRFVIITMGSMSFYSAATFLFQETVNKHYTKKSASSVRPSYI